MASRCSSGVFGVCKVDLGAVLAFALAFPFALALALVVVVPFITFTRDSKLGPLVVELPPLVKASGVGVGVDKRASMDVEVVRTLATDSWVKDIFSLSVNLDPV